MLILATIISSSMWGAVTTYTFTSKSFADGTSSWSSNTAGNDYKASQGVQCTTGKKGKATTKTTRSNVRQVTVIYCTNASSGAGSIVVKIGSNDAQSNSITKTGGTTLRTTTFTYATPQSGTISVQGNTSTNSIWIYGVSIITDSGSETCNDVDVTSGSAVVLPGGSTTYTTSAWKNNGSPTSYSATPVENTIGSGSHCVVFTQASDANSANGMQLKENEGVVLIRHIVSTAGVDISIVCSGTNGFTVELTGATTKTAQTGTVSIDTENTDATLVIKKVTANVGYLKTISITPKSSCTPIGAPSVTATPGDQRIDLEWTDQTGASSYTVTKTPSGGTIGTPSKDGSTWSCAITGLTNGTSYTWSVVAVGSGDYCDASGNTAASASATPNVSRTITYHDKDGSHTTSLTDGTTIATALTALYGGDNPESCDEENYEYFVGWTNEEISGSSSSVTLLDDEVVNSITAADTYYAVWSDIDPEAAGGWTQTTSVAAGDKVVIAQIDDGTKEMNAFNATITNASNYVTGASFTTNPDGLIIWTVEAGNSEGSFSFKNSDNYYLHWSSGNTVNGSATKDNYSSWTISLDNLRGRMTNVGQTTRVLMWNVSSPRFACYENKTHGNNSGSYYYNTIFYKQTSSGTPEYITTCCDNVVAAPTVSATNIHYNQFTLSWTNVTGADSYNVTCTGGTPGAIQSDGTTRTCTITGLASPNTSYSWTVVATYSGTYCGATPANGSTTTAQVYAVTYNANGGTVSPLPSTVSYEAGVTVTVAAEPGSTSKSGCTFTGWNTQADGQGTHYAASGSATFTMPSSTVTLYAEWTKKKNYYVDRMHGTNDGHTVTIDDVVYNCYLREGAGYTVPTISDNTSGATTCHNEHDHLLFWVVSTSVNDDGTLKGSYTEVTPGSSKTATTDGTIYYAIWGKLAD